MKIFIALTLLFFTIPRKQEIDIKKLKKDPDLISYRAVSKEITAGISSGKYNIPYSAIVQARKSGGNLQKSLEDAGMQNAKEYVDKLTFQSNSMKKFIKKHPEIMNLPQNERLELMKKLLKY